MHFVRFQNRNWPWNSVPMVSVKFFPLKTLGFFFFFFSEKAGVETWWVVNQNHNKRHYLLKIRLSFLKHWVTTWNETPLCRQGTGGLRNPDLLLLFFLMKQSCLWFYGHSWVLERHRSVPLLVKFLHSGLLLFLHSLCWIFPFIIQQRRN